MCSLNWYGYNFIEIDTSYANVGILFNLEEIPSLRLGFSIG